MTPQDLSARLRLMATGIEAAKNPDKDAVVRSLVAVLKIADGVDKSVVKHFLDFESKEPLLQNLIMTFNHTDEQFLKECGYPSEDALKSDDTPSGKEEWRVYQLLRKQTEIISNALRAIQPEIAAIDREVHGAL